MTPAPILGGLPRGPGTRALRTRPRTRTEPAQTLAVRALLGGPVTGRRPVPTRRATEDLARILFAATPKRAARDRGPACREAGRRVHSSAG